MQASYLSAHSLVLEGKLVEILRDYTAHPRFPAVPAQADLSKRVRIFMDWLSELPAQYLSSTS